jgi:hypothetical protein
MEFVFVDFATSRRVEMDGAPFGMTNRTLTCSPGHHTFDLSVPVNYSPVSQNVNVTGTTPTTPLHVLFRPAATAFIAVPAALAATRRTKRARKGAGKRTPARKSRQPRGKGKPKKRRGG